MRDTRRDVDWPRYASEMSGSETQRAQMNRPYGQEMAESTMEKMRDPVRWGAVWAGLIVALATFMLVELIFFALGWLNLEQGASTTSAGLISALIGALAFFVGGAVAGATTIWRGSGRGAVHGLLVWSLGVVGIIFLALFGGGALLGSLASAVIQADALQNLNAPNVNPNQALNDAREVAGWGILGLLAYLVAAVLGGMLGVKMWSRRRRESEAAAHAVR